MSRVLPILFNTKMVQAILRGMNPKTATRRLIKKFIPDDARWGYTVFTPKGYISCRGTYKDGYGEKFYKLPCEPGDILYIRETWAFLPCVECMKEEPTCNIDPVVYDDGDCESEGCFVYKGSHPRPEIVSWTPSIHMPKKAARIWLKVKDVRVEQIQDMTLDDFLSEGIVLRPEAFNDPDNAYLQARSEFAKIWDSTIKKGQQDLYSWDANQWVWVIEFERCEKP